MNFRHFTVGFAVRLHADGHAVLHLRHRRDAALRQLGPGAKHCDRATQQLQTHLPVTHAALQVHLLSNNFSTVWYFNIGTYL